MKTILQDTFLTTEELKELLKWRIKLERLVREYELRGLSEGYWSNAVIVALDRACGILPVERGQGARFAKPSAPHWLAVLSQLSVSSRPLFLD
ncbi:MAG: hypothetical protein KC931_24945, partial [Candidatus Omnitrophica bacterium]|nr:hypothetical protein [Candidatus Omnitrophota bacterium]